MDGTETEDSALFDLRARVSSHWENLAPAERGVVAMLIATEPTAILYESASKLGARTGTSGATVVRAAQALGYHGLAELKATVAREENQTSSPTVRLESRVKDLGGSVEEMLGAQAEEVSMMLDQLQEMTSSGRLSEAAALLSSAHQVHCYGIGVSGVIAALLAIRLSRLGVLARHVADDGFSAADALLQIRSDDVFVIFAPSRRTTQMSTILDEVQRIGAKSILVTADLAETRLTADSILFAPIGSRGMVSETTGGSLTVDLLVHLVTALGEAKALTTRNRLSGLRTRLGYGHGKSGHRS